MAQDQDRRPDERLIEDYLDGDPSVFRMLMDRHHDDLMRFLTRLMGSVSSAEDVFQETFLQVHTSLDRFDTERRFKPWLYTIAANKGRDALRRRKRRKAVSLSTPVGASPEGGELIDLLSGDFEGPGDLDADDRSHRVQHAINRMSSLQREVLLLAYFQQLSYAQLSDLLEVPLGTIKSRLHSAVASFAKHWEAVNQEMDARIAQDGA